MKARELMTSEPACCTPADPLREAAQLMCDHDCGCIPVVEDMEDRRLVGLVTDRDLACRGIARGLGPETPVQQVMSTDPKTCSAEDDLEMVEKIMIEARVRRVPVVDGRNRCVGMIAQADLALSRPGVPAQEVGRVVERISEPAQPSGARTGAVRR